VRCHWQENHDVNNFELRFRETRLAFRSFTPRIANGFSSLLSNHQGNLDDLVVHFKPGKVSRAYSKATERSHGPCWLCPVVRPPSLFMTYLPSPVHIHFFFFPFHHLSLIHSLILLPRLPAYLWSCPDIKFEAMSVNTTARKLKPGMLLFFIVYIVSSCR
jgi:hypothetical protein